MHTSGITPRRDRQDRHDQQQRLGRRAGRRTAASVALVALAVVALAGCTKDTDGHGGTLRSGERPLELSDVRLVSVSNCDDLVAAAEERSEAISEQMEAWQKASRSDGDVTTADAGGAAEAMSGADSGSAVDAPATTLVPMPSAAAESGTAGDSAAQKSGDEVGGTVIAGTNNQEQGVDEGDLAKTDGRVLVTVSSEGILRVIALDDSPQVDAQIDLDGDQQSTFSGGYGQPGQLMLRSTPEGREVVAVRSTYTNTDGMPVVDIARIDLTDPSAPVIVERARVAGELVATRLIGSVGRIVIRPALGGPIVEPRPVPTSMPPSPTTTEAPTPTTTEPDPSTTPTTSPAATSTTTTTTTTTTTEPSGGSETGRIPSAAAALLPQRIADDGTSEPLGDCDDVLSVPASAPIDPSTGWGTAAGSPMIDGRVVDVGYPSTSGVTVLTVGTTLGDLAPVTVEGGAETVYAGTDALYTTATTWSPTSTGGDSVTAVHRFDLTGEGAARYTGSGLIPGLLLNQYSMSDRDGALRVVTTAQTPVSGSDTTVGRALDSEGDVSAVEPAATSAGRITVLRPGDDGTLREVGHLDDLGLGEEVKSVRFIEDRAYVVTFRQTDPLFAVDMSTDTPKLLGELKIPGFSEYLHPVGDGRLLGIGSDADPQTGRVTGFKASLFDVSDPTNPVELDSFTEADATSLVGSDPHAFTWDPVRMQAIVPVTTSPSFGPTTPTAELPAPPTTIACPPNADCSSASPGIAADESYPAPWQGAWVIGVDSDRLVRRGTLTHDLGGWTDQILRSLVVDSTIWTVSAMGVDGHGADDLRTTATVRF